MNGFIKLHRQLIEWEWYQDTNVKCLFLHCLLKANFKAKKWQGNIINRGQFVTSYSHLAIELGLSVRNVRTAIEKLEGTNEIIRLSTSSFTVLTVCNFDSYQSREQGDRQTTDKQTTSDRQTTDKQTTTTKEGKEREEGKELKNKEIGNLPFLEEVREILVFFMSETGKQIKLSKLGRSDKYKKIMPRLNEGATVDECKAVISLKSKEWKNDKAMSKHLCIPTLFRASNFEKYLDELGTVLPSNKKFPYPLPEFLDKEDRQSYFYVRYNSYKPYLDIQKVNTIYKKRALYEKDAEGLCFELELKKPKLAELEIKYVRI